MQIVMKEARSWGGVEFGRDSVVDVPKDIPSPAADLWIGMGVAEEVKSAPKAKA